MARHHKVHELLTREQLTKLEEFARKPGRTIDQCHEWLLAEGFTISRSAVARWKDAFDQDETFSAATELAQSIVASAEKGAGAIGEATSVKVNQLVFEAALKAQLEGVDAGDLLKIAQAHRHGVLGHRDVERVRKEMADRQREAVEAAKKAAAVAGSTPDQIVSVIEKAFGIERK